MKIYEMIEKIQARPSDTANSWLSGTRSMWVGWLSEYHTSGFYNRRAPLRVLRERDAKYAYNHITNPMGLLWMIATSGASTDLMHECMCALSTKGNLAQVSAAIRKVAPWETVQALLR